MYMCKYIRIYMYIYTYIYNLYTYVYVYRIASIYGDECGYRLAETVQRVCTNIYIYIFIYMMHKYMHIQERICIWDG